MLAPIGGAFGTDEGSWSAHGRILEYIEQGNAGVKVNLEMAWTAPANFSTGVPTTRIPILLCPSEINDRVRTNSGAPYVYPHNYGFNFGTWLIWHPGNGQGGDGPFYPNARIKPSDVRDGLSNTLMLAEVKAFTSFGTRANAVIPLDPPATAAQVAAFVNSALDKRLGPNTNDNLGHTEWPEGRVHHSGFTTTLTPNTKVLVVVGGKEYDADFNSQPEGSSAVMPTRAVVTSRSYHSGGIVNVALMDGSVRSVNPNISLTTWRALGTIMGSEVLGPDF
jgi:prepilin-type processing-associated H-X9-DG protein